MTFESALFNHVKNNFEVSGYLLTFGFGEVSSKARAPYIVMHVLDSDGMRQRLCDTPFDSGNTFVQFNVYHKSLKNAFYLKHELDLFLSGLRGLTFEGESFKIDTIQHQPSPSGNFKDNGLGVDVVSKIFNYERG